MPSIAGDDNKCTEMREKTLYIYIFSDVSCPVSSFCMQSKRFNDVLEFNRL